MLRNYKRRIKRTCSDTEVGGIIINKTVSRFAIMSAIGTGVSVLIFGISIFIPKLNMIAYAPPKTAYFVLDILGYFFMSVSVFFLSFTISNNRLLKTSLIAVGVYGMTCIVVPHLPFLYQTSGSSQDAFGVTVLSLWSILFVPISILLAICFRKNGTVKI